MRGNTTSILKISTPMKYQVLIKSLYLWIFLLLILLFLVLLFILLLLLFHPVLVLLLILAVSAAASVSAWVLPTETGKKERKKKRDIFLSFSYVFSALAWTKICFNESTENDRKLTFCLNPCLSLSPSWGEQEKLISDLFNGSLVWTSYAHEWRRRRKILHKRKEKGRKNIHTLDPMAEEKRGDRK